MTTIKLKNGSGAPTAGDLAQGEPALDLTNKRLYTEDSGGTVIEVGTNPTSVTTGDITATGTATFAGLTTTADVSFGDNDKAIFGAGSDLQIYHDGSDSFVKDAGTGNLKLQGSSYVVIQSASGTNMVRAQDGAAVRLYHNGSEKLDTTSTGIDVTGTVTADGLEVEAATPVIEIDSTTSANLATLQFTTSGAVDSKITHQASTGVMTIDSGRNASWGGTIDFVTDTDARMRIASNGDISFYEDTGTTAKFFWDASEERLGVGTSSPSTTLDVEGTAQVNLLEVDHSGDRAINFVKTGANTFSIEHDVNQFYFWNQATSESPLLFQNDGDVIMNGGNVGIGTDSPSAKLHLSGDGDSASKLTVQRTGATTGTAVLGYNYVGSFSNNEFKVFANSTEAMRIDSSGNLGLGNSNPQNKLDIEQSAAVSARLLATGATSSSLKLEVKGGATQLTTTEILANSSGAMTFATGTTSSTERMRIDSSGNVGIGKSPSTTLEVASGSGNTDGATNSPTLRVTNQTNSTDWDVGDVVGTLEFYTDDSSGNAPYDASFIKSVNDAPNGTLPSGALTFGTATYNAVGGAVERMRIDSSGNVGIGTDSPSQALDVVGAIKVSDGILNAGVGGSASIFNEDGTTADFRVESSGNTHMLFVDGGLNNVGIGTDSPATTLDVAGEALIQGRLQVTSSAPEVLFSVPSGGFDSRIHNDGTGNFIFGTGTNSTTPTERMRIDSSGFLNVGVSSAITSSTNTSDGFTFAPSGGYAWLSVSDTGGIYVQRQNDNSVFSFYRGSSNVGSIGVTSSATTYNTSSDQRLKDNIVDAPSASDDIDAIQVRSFDWKADGSHQKYGMVAQELQSVAPEAVSGDADSDDMMGVDYSKLVPMLVKEIQSLRARVAQLEGAN